MTPKEKMDLLYKQHMKGWKAGQCWWATTTNVTNPSRSGIRVARRPGVRTARKAKAQ